MNKVIAISGDCHVGGPWLDFEPYLEEAWREKYRAERRALMAQLDERRAKKQALPSHVEEVRREREAFLRSVPGDEEASLDDPRGFGFDRSLTGLFDPNRRLAQLEADGVVAEVCYPQASPFGGFHFAPCATAEVDIANARAVNRWGAEFVSAAPHRFAWPVWVPLWDIEVALEEMREGRKRGLRGLYLTSQPEACSMVPYTSPLYEPLWNECVELGMPISMHGTPTPPDSGTGGSVVWRYELGLRIASGLRQLVFGGVLERHPKLRVLLSETGAHGWLLQELEQMDAFYEGRWGKFAMRTHDPVFWEDAIEKDRLKRRPSEYVRENVLVQMGCALPGWEARHAIGIANLAWGNDYPHVEGTWAVTREEIARTWAATSPTRDDIESIMGKNLARAYGFDLDALRPIAERCGIELPPDVAPQK